MKYLVAALCLTASQAAADLNALVNERILPGFAGFEEATKVLADQAAKECFGETTKTAYQAAFDAWMRVDHYRVGPSTTRIHEVVFWPDTRGFTPKALRTLINEQDPVINVDYSEVSIAARGLMSLDYLLYDADFAELRSVPYSCELMQAITSDLNLTAKNLVLGWTNYSTTLVSAAEGNDAFRNQKEAESLIYTQLVSGLEFAKNTRIGQPLGTLDKPRPKRAEAWRSGRPLRNILLLSEAIVGDAAVFYDDEINATENALTAVKESASRIKFPTLDGIGEPQDWLYLSILQERVGTLHDAIANEVGIGMGLSAGFNSSDGD